MPAGSVLTMTTIIVFDIDMTLIRTNGAGRRAMNRTFLHLYGIPDAFAGMAVAGRTDGAILRDGYLRHALHDRDLLLEFESFRVRYFAELERELRETSGVDVLPGVAPLLGILRQRPDVRLGLGTGNYKAAAELKLRHVDLWESFAGGGYADDSEDRAEVIAAGIMRLKHGVDAPSPRVWVVGDSPHDVSAGKANGAFVLGVATGSSDRAELLGAGADVVMDDLSDTAVFLATTLDGNAG